MNKIFLKDVAVSQTGPFGSQLHEEDYVEKGTPIVTVEHLGEIGFTHQNLPFVSDEDTKRLSRYLLKEGDIVFSRVGSVDRNTYVSKEEEGWLFSGRCIRVRVDEKKINSKFLSFYFRQKNFKKMMQDIAVGATMPSLNTNLMDTLPLSVPDIKTQNKITIVLSTLDEKIELNNKINAELEQTARLIYDYWFTQFDFPDAQGKPYKSSGGAMKFSPELNREIPEGWHVKGLMDAVSWIGGAQPPKSTFKYQKSDGYIRFVQNRDYASDQNLTYIPIAKSNKVCDELDIMMDKYGDAGAIRFGLAGAYNVALSKIDPRIPNTQEYIRSFLSSKWIYEYLHAACLASTRASLNEDILSNLNIAVPREDILVRYERIQKNIIKKILANRQQSQKLAHLRDWLLPMLMNGQVKVL